MIDDERKRWSVGEEMIVGTQFFLLGIMIFLEGIMIFGLLLLLLSFVGLCVVSEAHKGNGYAP